MFHLRLALRPLFLMLLLCLPGLAAAQVCTDPGAYCEGWSRDSTRREIGLSRTTICAIGLTPCPATCSTSPIKALPSIRIGNLNHAVLGFSVSDACVPECSGSAPEPCYNLGVSYRRSLAGGSEAVSGVYDCDPTDPGTTVATGATFTGDYAQGGTETVTISNIVYGNQPIPADNCGAAPLQLDMNATSPNMAVQSHFTFTWDAFNNVAAYTETRTYFTLPAPNTVHIAVSNINYGAGTFTASVPDAGTSVHSSTWGQLKVLYR
jgi:hypothetical protein